MYLTPPLKTMKLTQPFGVDWTGDNLYASLGMKGHNGWDLRAATGTPVFACMAGELYVDYEPGPNGTLPAKYDKGYGVNVRIRSRELGLESVYGHLLKPVRTGGSRVAAGELIAISDDTGTSSGPHLHWGLRRIEYRADGSGPYWLNTDNGYFGYVDNAQFMAPDVFALPADKCYGLTPATPGVPSEWQMLPAQFDFWRTFKRLMTTREYNAFRFGFWDRRTVLDDSMFDIWSSMTKPEAQRHGIIRKAI